MKAPERMFKKSHFRYGDEIVANLPFETGRTPTKISYLSDCTCGILVDCNFDGRHYRRVISWASVYCGDVKVKSADGDLVAVLEKKPEIVWG